jgi:hypothetical protein
MGTYPEIALYALDEVIETPRAAVLTPELGPGEVPGQGQ